MTVFEPARETPVYAEADVFIAGGSCTGVFAAIRAARSGCRVFLAEKQGMPGGVATSGLVNVWHSLKDTDYREQVIAGLTAEVAERMKARGRAEFFDDPSVAIRFDPMTLAYELDKLIAQEKITVLYHTLCVGAVTDGSRITAALIENKDGRSAVKAGFFIDATGDGDLLKRLGFTPYEHAVIQPPTPCFLLQGDLRGVSVARLIKEHGGEFGLPDDFGWGGPVPGLDGIQMRADFHVFGEKCDSAAGLSAIETEGRRKAQALVELLKTYGGVNASVVAYASAAGVRESVHYATRRQAHGADLLSGARYEDAILNGTYRIDVHDTDGNVTLWYLNGEKVRLDGVLQTRTVSDHRKEAGLTGEPPRFYQIPFDVLVQERFENLIAAGRMLNADQMAFGALRVMVNLNQIGEAAGTAAALCLDANVPVQKLDGRAVRRTLRAGGSAL